VVRKTSRARWSGDLCVQSFERNVKCGKSGKSWCFFFERETVFASLIRCFCPRSAQHAPKMYRCIAIRRAYLMAHINLAGRKKLEKKKGGGMIKKKKMKRKIRTLAVSHARYVLRRTALLFRGQRSLACLGAQRQPTAQFLQGAPVALPSVRTAVPCPHSAVSTSLYLLALRTRS